MKTYTMIVQTEDEKGNVATEFIRHVPEHELDSRRAKAREGCPMGLTRTIKVGQEH